MLIEYVCVKLRRFTCRVRLPQTGDEELAHHAADHLSRQAAIGAIPHDKPVMDAQQHLGDERVVDGAKQPFPHAVLDDGREQLLEMVPLGDVRSPLVWYL